MCPNILHNMLPVKKIVRKKKGKIMKMLKLWKSLLVLYYWLVLYFLISHFKDKNYCIWNRKKVWAGLQLIAIVTFWLIFEKLVNSSDRNQDLVILPTLVPITVTTVKWEYNQLIKSGSGMNNKVYRAIFGLNCSIRFYILGLLKLLLVIRCLNYALTVAVQYKYPHNSPVSTFTQKNNSSLISLTQ